MKKKVVVVGGGHNGLTAAAFLARRGFAVSLFEKNAALGGIAASTEIAPGYRSAGVWPYTSQVRPEIVDALNLERFGLKWKTQVDNVYLPDAGQFLSEAPGYREYQLWIDKIRPFLMTLFSEKTFSIELNQAGDWWSAAKTALKLRGMGEKDMIEFMQVAPMPVRDFLREKFPENDAAQAALALPAVWGGVAGPWAPMTNLNLLAWEGTQGRSLEGGPQSLIQALKLAAENYGVTLQTEATVDEIVIEDGKVTGVRIRGEKEDFKGNFVEASFVFSSVNPKTTFLNLLKPEAVPLSLEREIGFVRSRGNVSVLHLALKEKPDLSWTHARVCESLAKLEKSFDALKYRELPEQFALDLYYASKENPVLAPSQGAVLSVLAFGSPYWLKSGWEKAARTRAENAIIQQLEETIPGVKNQILGTQFLSPHDLESQYGLWEGHLFHGEQAPDQMLMMRPTPVCAHYQTPLKGLYLCGSGSHPGGGLTMAPAALAVSTLIRYEKGRT